MYTANLPSLGQIFTEMLVPNNFVLISKKIVFSNLSVSLVNGFGSVGTEWALDS